MSSDSANLALVQFYQKTLNSNVTISITRFDESLEKLETHSIELKASIGRLSLYNAVLMNSGDFILLTKQFSKDMKQWSYQIIRFTEAGKQYEVKTFENVDDMSLTVDAAGALHAIGTFSNLYNNASQGLVTYISLVLTI